MLYADKPWLKHYDEGVPHSLAPYPTYPVHQFLIESARKYPDAPAIMTTAHIPVLGRLKAEITYRELNESSDALATALGDLGIVKGDRVAIVMPNCTQFIIAFFAISKAGGVVVGTNPTYPANKMAEQIKDSGAKAVIVLSLFYTLIKQIQPQTDIQQVIVTNIKTYLPPVARVSITVAKEAKEGHRIEKRPEDHDLGDLVTKYAGRKSNVEVKGSDLVIFQYTGGTTGTPKAAMSTHSALVANTLHCMAWDSGRGDRETWLCAIPLFHVFGMIAVMSFGMGVHATLIMIPNPRETHEVLEVIDKYHPRMMCGVPAMFNAINSFAGVENYNLKSIRVCISGSAPLPLPTKRRFEQLIGGVLIEGYGMSETPTATHINPFKGENREGSIGLLMPDMEARIVNIDDGETDVPVGEAGELLMNGPQIMVGYHNRPEDTQLALRPDRDSKIWLHTGDIARMDEDGYFFIVDRKKDMAIIGGFKVYPNLVEKVIVQHSAVLEVSVTSIPHPNPQKIGQEALKAWVKLKPGVQCSEKELLDFASKSLARHELPSMIQFVDDLPRTTIGKVLRRELQEVHKQSEAEKAVDEKAIQ